MNPRRKRYAQSNSHEQDKHAIFLNLVGKFSSGDGFVNVGAVVGYYPSFSKTKNSWIIAHCFEPLQRHLNGLHANMELNGLSRKSILSSRLRFQKNRAQCGGRYLLTFFLNR